MYIEIEDTVYHLEKRGEGKPVICLHGFSENTTTWDRITLDGYQMICLDFIGHGKSDRPIEQESYSLERMVSHLHQILQCLNLSQCSLLGYSMGGRIALAYGLSHPDEVERLILESASYGEVSKENQRSRRERDEQLARQIEDKGIEWFDQYWSQLPIFQSLKDLSISIQEDIRNRRLGNSPHALANTLRSTGQGIIPCVRDKIGDLSMPILYISGEYDEKYRQIGEDFARLNPKVTHITIQGCGHNIHIADHQRFMEVVHKFLSNN